MSCKCYTTENIIYNDLCSDCKILIIDTLNKCVIMPKGENGHDISNIIISDVLVTYYYGNDNLKIERIKPTMNLDNIRIIDFGSKDNNNFIIIMLCKNLITYNDLWKQINKQLLNRLFIKNKLADIVM